MHLAWRKEALAVIPPRLALGPFKEVLFTIHLPLPLRLKSDEFTQEELRGVMVEELKRKGFYEGHPRLAEGHKAIRVLPEIMQKLVEADLLEEVKTGRYRKSRDFGRFWTLIIKTTNSAEKMIYWALYQMIRKHGRNFKTDDLIQLITSIGNEIEEEISNLTIPMEEGWERVIEKRGTRWRVQSELPDFRVPFKPLLISETQDKLLFGVSVISKSKNEFTTDELIGLIRSIEREETERILRKVCSERSGSWQINDKFWNDPQELIRLLEYPTQLPPLQTQRVYYPISIKFRCLRCAKCCADPPNGIRRILLLKSDILRIRNATQKEYVDFCTPFTDSKTHPYEMKKRRSGECIFLQGNFCTIYEHRPLNCRFHPFKLEEVKPRRTLFEWSDECPGIGKGRELSRRFFENLLKLVSDSYEVSKEQMFNGW